MKKELNIIIFISAVFLAIIGIEIIGTLIYHYSPSVFLGLLTSKERKILWAFTAIMQVIGIIATIIKLKTDVNRKAKFYIKIYLLIAILFIVFFAFGLLFGAGMKFYQPY